MSDERTIDKTAIAKTFWLVLVSILFVIIYGSHIRVCDSDVDVENVTESACRMSIYDGGLDVDGKYVKTWYYLAIWVGIGGWSFIGLALQLCNCNMLVRRIFCFGLVGGMGLVSIAEFLSIDSSRKAWNNVGDNVNTDLRNSFLALAAAVWAMEIYLLGTTVCDAWTED